MKYIQTFDGNVKAKGVTTDTLFYSSLATDGLTIENGVVTAYNGNAKAVYIPDFFNGVAVTRIGNSVFSGHTEIVEVRFPKRLEYISASAFNGCTGLVSVELGDIDLDISPSIEGGAFGGCTSLRSVTINAVYLSTIESGAFGIASGQVCALYRPTSVEDESAWETIANRENLRLAVKYSTKKAFDSEKAQQDGEGYNIAEHYAKKTGTYQSMTVGNAVTASKATTTDFTNKTWQTGTSSGVTLTTGAWQLYCDSPISYSGDPYNVSLGVVYFDGTHATYTSSRFSMGENASINDIFVNIDKHGNVSLRFRATNGDSTSTGIVELSKLHYREIK